MGQARETRATGNIAGSNGAEASQEEPTGNMARGTGRKPALRNRLATTRGPPVTMRAATLRHATYASRAHVDCVPHYRGPVVSPPICGPRALQRK